MNTDLGCRKIIIVVKKKSVTSQYDVTIADSTGDGIHLESAHVCSGRVVRLGFDFTETFPRRGA